MLLELSSTRQIVPLTSVVKLMGIASLALIPVVFNNWIKKKID